MMVQQNEASQTNAQEKNMRASNIVTECANGLFIMYMIMSLTVLGYYNPDQLSLIMATGFCVIVICAPLMSESCFHPAEYALHASIWAIPVIYSVQSQNNTKTICIAVVSTIIMRWRIESQTIHKREMILQSIWHAHDVFTGQDIHVAGFHYGQKITCTYGPCWVGSYPGQRINPGYIPIMKFDQWSRGYIFDQVPADDASLREEVGQSDDDDDGYEESWR